MKRPLQMSYQDLINTHLQYIEWQCQKALKQSPSHYQSIEYENECLILFNRILDKLQAENFKILRNFKGKAKITTYLTTIISYQAIDMIRQKKGRNQKKERAKEWGEMGNKIYQLVFKNTLSVKNAYKEMEKKGYFTGSICEFEEIIQKIKGKEIKIIDLNQAGIAVKGGIQSQTEDEVIIPDNTNNPETIFLKSQRAEKIKEAIKKVLSTLSGQEQLLLRMRFPKRDIKEAIKIDEIAGMFNISTKAAYNRLDRILKKCKKYLKKEGIDEFL